MISITNIFSLQLLVFQGIKMVSIFHRHLLDNVQDEIILNHQIRIGSIMTGVLLAIYDTFVSTPDLENLFFYNVFRHGNLDSGSAPKMMTLLLTIDGAVIIGRDNIT